MSRLRALLGCSLIFGFIAITLATPSTESRFTAQYGKKTTVTAANQLDEPTWNHLVHLAPELDALRSEARARAAVATYSEYTSGSADIDTLHSVFRFNVTYVSYSTNGVAVANSKPRSTTLLMYDVILNSYDSSLLYRAGSNFTWTTPLCTCSPISSTIGGGAPPLFVVHPNAVEEGNKVITVNKKSITSTLYTYTTSSYLPSESPFPPVDFPITFQFFVSTSRPNFLDRVSYTFHLANDVVSSVEYDFWSRTPMTYSSAIVPDVSCRKACIDNDPISIRAHSPDLYPESCIDTPASECVCMNISNTTNHFCPIPWSISSDIDIDTVESYAMFMKNLTVDFQPNPLQPECVDQMVDFICKFYFPPCDPYNARMRPPINGTMPCFRNAASFYTPAGMSPSPPTSTPFANPSELIKLASSRGLDEETIAVDMRRIVDTLSLDEGPIALPETIQSLDDAEPMEPIPVPSAPTESPSDIPPSASTPDLPPSASTPDLTPSTTAPDLPPVTPPVNESAIMSPQIISRATSFALFSAYDVVARQTVTYPDIYTLKNWQIALMLVGSVLLLLTIIISIVMANRKVGNHYQKV